MVRIARSMIWLVMMRLPVERFTPLLVCQCQACAYNIRFTDGMGMVLHSSWTRDGSPRAS